MKIARLSLLCCAVLCLFLPNGLAQQDGTFGHPGGQSVGADPGYAVYGDTSPYPTGNEDLPWNDSDATSRPSQGSARPSPAERRPQLPTRPRAANDLTGGPPYVPFSSATTNQNPYEVVTPQRDTAHVSPESTQYYRLPDPSSLPTPQPTIGPAPNPIDSWTGRIQRQLGPTVPETDRTKIAETAAELQRLQRERYEQRWQDLSNVLVDMGSAMGGGLQRPSYRPYDPRPYFEPQPDTPSAGEAILDRNRRIGKLQDDLNEYGRRHNFDPAAPAIRAPDRPPEDFDVRSILQLNTKQLFPDFEVSPSTGGVFGAGPGDPGGIDFRTIRLVYLSEHQFRKPGSWQMQTLGFGLQAVPGKTESGVQHLRGQSRLLSNALFVFLTVPDRDLWVNLHPNEPNRIVSASLRRTEVGRVMLEADFQLKKDAGKLMHQKPFATAEADLVQSVLTRVNATRPQQLEYGSTGRVEISSATSQVFATENSTDIYIHGITLDVVFEQKAFHIRVRSNGSYREIELLPIEFQQFVDLTQKLVRPTLIARVNRAPEYEELRQAFSARVLADWYKRRRRSNGSLASLIDTERLAEVHAEAPFDPVAFWRTYKANYDSSTERGFGGVTWSTMPSFQSPPTSATRGPMMLAGAIDSPRGLLHQGVYRAGGTLIALKTSSISARVGMWISAGLVICMAAYLVKRKRVEPAGVRR